MEIQSFKTFRNSTFQKTSSGSDPATYMVRQVAQAVENNNVKSRFKIALAWNSKTDLDAWVREIEGVERIANKKGMLTN
jgi:hypothetical protein